MPPFPSNLLFLLPCVRVLEGIRIDKVWKGGREIRTQNKIDKIKMPTVFTDSSTSQSVGKAQACGDPYPHQAPGTVCVLLLAGDLDSNLH